MDAWETFLRRLPTMTGSVQVFPLPSVLQHLAADCKSGRLIVRCGNREGAILFIGGAIYDAQAGLYERRDAVDEMLGWTDVSYEFVDWSVRRVEESVEQIVLQSATRDDEGGRSPA